MKQNPKNTAFVGREPETQMLEDIEKKHAPAIIIVYGRRRVGKTELLERVFKKRHLLKFEGIQGKDAAYQRAIVMQQLAEHMDQPLLRQIDIKNWLDVFKYIHQYTKQGEWTIYFEELQWLANYEEELVGELKYAWDNFFRHNKKMVMILCGSSPSFMINQVAQSKALYNRSQHEIHLKELNLAEAKTLLGRYATREVMDAYLTIGGIPEYLLHLKTNSSLFLSLCDQSFKFNSYFSQEYKRIFISSMSENKNYRKIIEFLAKKRFATREEILAHLKMKSGGRVSEIFEDLLLCGFIDKYAPYNLNEEGKLVRYCIQDPYLNFYYRFIKPVEGKIKKGDFNLNPSAALKTAAYQQSLGYAFERYCRRYSRNIAKILGFSGIHYQDGAYFNRKSSEENPGFQIDLIFDRDDSVITVCEIKYSKNLIKAKVVDEFEKKLELLPNPKQKAIHKVLICSNGAEKTLINQGYFDCIITLDDLLKASD